MGQYRQYDPDEVIDYGEGGPFVIDRTAKPGEVYFSPDTETAADDAIRSATTAAIPDPGARRWAEITRPDQAMRPRSLGDLPPLPGQVRQCLNAPRCDGDGLIHPALGSRRRKFCSPKCAHNYHSRRHYHRRLGRGNFLEYESDGRQVQFERVKPTTVDKAKELYQLHLEAGKCPNATDDTRRRCPSHFLLDPYSERKLCLVYAVRVDDMKELYARSRHEFYPRQWTTHDGRWIDHSEFGPHLPPTPERESFA